MQNYPNSRFLQNKITKDEKKTTAHVALEIVNKKQTTLQERKANFSIFSVVFWELYDMLQL